MDTRLQLEQNDRAQIISVYDNFETIDWIRDLSNDRTNRERLDHIRKTPQNKIYRQFYRSQAWLYVVLIGLLTGLSASYIDIGVQWLSSLRFGHCEDNFFQGSYLCCQDIFSMEVCSNWRRWHLDFGVDDLKYVVITDYLIYITLSVLYAALAAWFVFSLAKWASGSGIPEVKTTLSGFVIRTHTSWQTLLVKFAGLILAVSSGLKIGKQGPLVHVSVCIADILSNIFAKFRHNEAKKREIMSAAAAAGVAVAFAAPIGGVLFSMEEVSYYFPHKTQWRAFFCACIAALVLGLTTPYDKTVLFQVTYTDEWYYFELIPFAIIGLVGGLLGAIFIKINIQFERFRRNTRVRKYPISQVVVIALMTAVVSYFNIYLRGDTAELIGDLFAQCDSEMGTYTPNTSTELHSSESLMLTICSLENMNKIAISLVLAAITRYCLALFTVGLPIPSGLFIPGMAIGACIGRAVGIWVQSMQLRLPELFFFGECPPVGTCVTPGVYALIGSASILSGLTRMTLSLTVIMFELSGNVNYILPIMLSVMISKWVADAFGRLSIYDAIIKLRGYPFLDNKTEHKRFKATASDVMSKKLAVIPASGNTIKSLQRFLDVSPNSGFPVVSDQLDMYVVGYIARSELAYALNYNQSLKNLPSSTPCYFVKRDVQKARQQGLDCASNILGDEKTDMSDFVLIPGTTQTASMTTKEVLGHVQATQEEQKRIFVDLRPYMDQAPFQIRGRASLNIIIDIFKKMGLRYLLIVSHGKLKGIVTKKDVLQYLALKDKKKIGKDAKQRESVEEESHLQMRNRRRNRRRRFDDHYNL